MKPNTSTAVMNRRIEPPDSLDFFPTPPWATRALCELALGMRRYDVRSARAVWEPAAGEGHMAEVLAEYFGVVHASDIHDYGRGYPVGDFLGDLIRAERPGVVDWVITNPPFNAAEGFLLRALTEAQAGVALLLRLSWLEGGGRFERVFSTCPPSETWIFSERVPMHRGRWEPEGSTTTAYAWMIWRHPRGEGDVRDPRLRWFPPGLRERLTRPEDAARFGVAREEAGVGPLFGGGE